MPSHCIAADCRPGADSGCSIFSKISQGDMHEVDQGGEAVQKKLGRTFREITVVFQTL